MKGVVSESDIEMFRDTIFALGSHGANVNAQNSVSTTKDLFVVCPVLNSKSTMPHGKINTLWRTTRNAELLWKMS